MPRQQPGACERNVSQPEGTGLSSGKRRAAQGGCDESTVHVMWCIVEPVADLNHNLQGTKFEKERAKCPEFTLKKNV